MLSHYFIINNILVIISYIACFLTREGSLPLPPQEMKQEYLFVITYTK